MTNEQAVAEAFAHWDEQGIEIDIVINNAGIQFRKPLIELALNDWQRMIDTNLTSAFIVSKEAAKRMIARGTGGKIVNIGSLTSEAVRATLGACAAAKGGTKMLTRASSNPSQRWGTPEELVGTAMHLASAASSIQRAYRLRRGRFHCE